MKWRGLLLIVLLVALLAVAWMQVSPAQAAGPSDEMLYAAYMCKGGLGLPALQWFTTKYGYDHPGLNWNVSYAAILNDYCGYQIVNPDTQQASWIVRVYAPYLQASFGTK